MGIYSHVMKFYLLLFIIIVVVVVFYRTRDFKISFSSYFSFYKSLSLFNNNNLSTIKLTLEVF